MAVAHGASHAQQYEEPQRKVSTSALRRWRTKGEVSLWAIQFTKALKRKGDGTTMAQGGDL